MCARMCRSLTYLSVVCAGLVPAVMGQQESCFSGGSVAGAAVGAFLGAIFFFVAAYYIRKFYFKSRKGKHLVFTTDPESVKDEFAFDNPGFRQDENKPGWQHDAATLPLGGKQHALSAEFTRPGETKISSAVSKDDLQAEKARVRTVKLWARDFTGLGLRAAGGAREGVRVHSVLRAGPAAAAGLQPGDKIKSIKIELTGTVLEDAVGILSLASPYPVQLEIEESAGGAGGKTSGEGRSVEHPLLKRHGSVGDVHTLEKELRHLHPPKSPNTSHSNNSTLETKHTKGGIKKIITEKIITTTTLERAKKDKERQANSTLERENEKNVKLAKNRHSEGPIISKPERNKRNSMGSEVQIIQPENGIMAMDRIQKAEIQKKEYDPKRGMKFGIRVLPPNIPDDGIIKTKIENGDVNTEKKGIDEPDKLTTKPVEMRVENEVSENKTKPVVAKRREKLAPPVPNARNLNKNTESDISDNSRMSEQSVTSSFLRDDLNSSGIRRDENGIPQELPQHMLEAANYARNNRKSEYNDDTKHNENRRESDYAKNNKKAKGKAPSPPEYEKNKTDDNIFEQLKNVNQFLNSEKLHSSDLHNSSILNPEQPSNSYNTSTPKTKKIKTSGLDESINFSQDDIDDIVSKPFKRESDSLNNFYEDSKSNLSSNLDVHSVVSLNNSDKGSTTIELNNSDITIHSSPNNETLPSGSDEASILEENERKAASLGDLSRFENRAIMKPSEGTLERAQSLDISADDTVGTEKVISAKRKSKSVVEATFFDSSNTEDISDKVDSDTIVIKSKEPRLSLNLAKSSAMEGLSTFQRNRLKKGSEFGNLEDAIVKGSNSSLDSDKDELSALPKYKDYEINIHNQDEEIYKLTKLSKDIEETSDHLAKKIMDENLKVNFKLVSEFAKSTSDGSNLSSMDNEPKSDILYTAQPVHTEFPSSLTMTYDTNIPDDMKVSRHTLVNSLERPKSDMMKKLLAKNPALNVHIDQAKTDIEDRLTTAISDSSKASHQPDVVNFNVKESKFKPDEMDDFVSNIRIGSNNNSLNYEKRQIYEPNWNSKPQIDKQNNIVTITTKERTESPIKKDDINKVYTKSIEIGESRRVPDVIEEVSRSMKIRSESTNDPMIISNSRTYFTEPTINVEVTQTEEPVQKTVTVNVAEDEFGNKIITQNFEQVSSKYITTKTEAPLQVEQISFGIIKNPKELDRLALEEGENIKDMDEKILQEIKRQNPNMHFTTDEPAYSTTETIILNTNLDEADALALMEKLKNDPSFMSQRTSEELSQLGIRVAHDMEDDKEKTEDGFEVTKTRYTINPAIISAYTEKCLDPRQERNEYKKRDEAKSMHEIKEKISEANKNHITEIQVMTPRTEKLMKQKSDVTKPEKPNSKQRSTSFSEPELSYELDISLLNDFISNERRHSAKDIVVLHRQQKRGKAEKLPEPKSTRHSDFDLPRNTQIKFRTATYESPKGTIVTSTDLENRRMSQVDQMRTNIEQQYDRNSPSPPKPVISAKPSNIPVKLQDKSSKPVISLSKIPVFMSQKSQSQENLSERSMSLARESPPKLGGSSGNISVTSIKSSSRNPSGK